MERKIINLRVEVSRTQPFSGGDFQKILFLGAILETVETAGELCQKTKNRDGSTSSSTIVFQVMLRLFVLLLG